MRPFIRTNPNLTHTDKESEVLYYHQYRQTPYHHQQQQQQHQHYQTPQQQHHQHHHSIPINMMTAMQHLRSNNNETKHENNVTVKTEMSQSLPSSSIANTTVDNTKSSAVYTATTNKPISTDAVAATAADDNDDDDSSRFNKTSNCKIEYRGDKNARTQKKSSTFISSSSSSSSMSSSSSNMPNDVLDHNNYKNATTSISHTDSNQSMSKSNPSTPILTPTAAYHHGISPSLVNSSVIMMLMMMNGNGNTAQQDPLIDIIKELLSQHREMRMAMSRDDIDEVQNILIRVRHTLDHPALASANSNTNVTAASNDMSVTHQNYPAQHHHHHPQTYTQQQHQQGESSILLRSSIAYLTQQIVNVSRPRNSQTHHHQPFYTQNQNQHAQNPALTNGHISITNGDADETSSTSSNWLPVNSPIDMQHHENVKPIAHTSRTNGHKNIYDTRNSRKSRNSTSNQQQARKLNKSERAFTRAVAKKISPANATNAASLSPVDDLEDDEEDEPTQYDDLLEQEYDIEKHESDSTNLSDLPSEDSDEYEPSVNSRRRRSMIVPTTRGRGNTSRTRVASNCTTSSAGRPVKRVRSDDDADVGNRTKRASPAKRNGGNVDGDGIVRRPNHPEHVSRVLKAWLFGHTDHPYPTDEEKDNLCRQTGLSITQCNNWFINARRRLLPQKN